MMSIDFQVKRKFTLNRGKNLTISWEIRICDSVDLKIVIKKLPCILKCEDETYSKHFLENFVYLPKNFTPTPYGNH